MTGDRVLVTSRSFGSGAVDTKKRLAEAGLVAVPGPADHDLAALRPALAEAVAWIVGTGPIRAEHLDAAPGLRVIARYGTGVDAIDLSATAARGVVVTNTPGANAEAVADHTVALMLAALRRLVDADRAARAVVGPPGLGRELGSLTAGLVGFGAVGQAVARRLRGFGGRLLAYDPYVPADVVAAHGAEPVPDLERLATASDLVTLHLPGGGRPVVDAAFLERLRARAVLVNTARADLVDEDAVAAALADGRLAAAGVDVYAGPGSPLLSAPNVVVTPHVAAQTTEAVDRMGMMAVEEVLRVLSGDPPSHPVHAEHPEGTA